MERNVPKSGLVNLAVAIIIFIAAIAVTCLVNSLAGEGACIFLLVTALVAFWSWFQTRLEENERLERLEVEELARTRGESALFETKESEVFAARRAREQFEKYFVPGFAVLLLIIEAGGAWVLWRWIGKTTTPIVEMRATASLSLFAIFALLLFLIGRFSVTMARLEDRRLLRPGSSFILASAYICAFTALAIMGVSWAGFLRADVWVARAFCILLGLMAAEVLLTLLLEIYRPRVRGKISRPLYESRLVGILAQPETLFTTAAQTLDYQFGFKVSETWFFKLLKENLSMLLLVQLAVLLLSTSVVFVNAGEQAILEHFGKPVAVLDAGAHFKWPWPVDEAYRYRTEQIQSLYVGYQPDTNEAQVILWTVPHNQEQNFLVATRPSAVENEMSEEEGSVMDQALKAPPVSLITISIPIQFEITNVMQWAYKNSDPTNLLESLATRAVVQYLAGEDIDDLMSSGRFGAVRKLESQIQSDADAHQLGVKIVFVGLQDIHPPTPVAADYEKVIGAQQSKLAAILSAQADAIATNALSQAQAFSTTNMAAANRLALEMSWYARAAQFTNQIQAFEAAPSVFKQRAYYTMFADATRNSRKYVLLVTNTQDVLIFDLQDKIRADLMNVTPE
ncbi:MAG TPA: SPFH domain-containing protein [Candidatus Sulfotelmatobacter sp.]|nr:SPFH domain-containing protein [Candidatus Sulfotelmatobacter sp.]